MINETITALIRWFGAGLLVSAMTLAGCAVRPGVMYATPEQGEQSFGSVAELVEQLQGADYIILGERHDNPEHHALQLATLQQLYQRGWLKQIVMEMLTPSQQALADQVVEQRISDLAQLRKRLQWHQGWDWQLYGPIIAWAATNGIPLVAGNLDAGELETAKENPARLGYQLLGEAGIDIHQRQFQRAHCGHITPKREEMMLRVQVARDARMAGSLQEQKGAVLLAGNWHARKDIGVPRYVLANEPEAVILTLGAMERGAVKLSDGQGDPSEQYDIVWFTGAVDRPDYCQKLGSKTADAPKHNPQNLNFCPACWSKLSSPAGQLSCLCHTGGNDNNAA